LAKRKKKRSLFAALLDILLTPIDCLCEGVAFLLVSLMKGMLKLLVLLLRGVWALLGVAVRAAAWPFIWLWRRLTGRHLRAERCLRLTGEEFESYVALLLRDHYYRKIELTKGSGDQGVDILCERNGKTYAIQCKNYAGAVGNFAVQEAYAGAEFYGCDIPVVVCPGSFTRGAIELAESTGVELWDGERLSRMMKKSGRKPKHSKIAQS
jgi:restriction system protein